MLRTSETKLVKTTALKSLDHTMRDWHDNTSKFLDSFQTNESQSHALAAPKEYEFFKHNTYLKK